MASAETTPVRGLASGERAALVISECQQAMVLEELRGERDQLARQVAEQGTLSAIAALADDFRASGLPVFHSWFVPHADWRAFATNCALAALIKRAGALREGHRGTLPHPLVAAHDDDFVVARRTGMTAFYGTELDAQLRALGIDTVVLVGVSINVAVYGSAIEAVNRGYQVVVPSDCVAGVGDIASLMLQQLYPLLATVADRRAVAGAIGATSAERST